MTLWTQIFQLLLDVAFQSYTPPTQKQRTFTYHDCCFFFLDTDSLFVPLKKVMIRLKWRPGVPIFFKWQDSYPYGV